MNVADNVMFTRCQKPIESFGGQSCDSCSPSPDRERDGVTDLAFQTVASGRIIAAVGVTMLFTILSRIVFSHRDKGTGK